MRRCRREIFDLYTALEKQCKSASKEEVLFFMQRGQISAILMKNRSVRAAIMMSQRSISMRDFKIMDIPILQNSLIYGADIENVMIYREGLIDGSYMEDGYRKYISSGWRSTRTIFKNRKRTFGRVVWK